jgi:hypothetical protein
MDNAQKQNISINVPSSQTFRCYIVVVSSVEVTGYGMDNHGLMPRILFATTSILIPGPI